jgi:UDP-N-acetylglucosamine--N-acetylmuramyl-(pentapeptide) pyrophosphoryl-undecaprenol N-acetylglucosamine transferase
MKYLISGGGTGGHINPGLAIAKEIISNEPEAEILFVGTKNGLESRLVPREGFNIEYIEVKGFKRKFSADTFRTVGKLVKSFGSINRILKKFKPDAVIGTGGYVCGPVVLSAALKKIPTLVHEQNAFPGATNKILSHFADIVAISFEEARPKFRGKAKITLTGNPVKSELLTLDKTESRKKLGLDLDKPLVIIFGGSLGAEHINKCVTEMINLHSEQIQYQLVVATGLNHYDSVMKEINVKLPPYVRIEPYIYNMGEYLAGSDLAVCRGGAITLSELTALGVPSILVPSPYVAENHQEYNARALEHKGAAVVILQNQLDSEILYDQIHKLISNEGLRSKMSSDARNMGIRNASASIYFLLKEAMKS